MSNVRQKTPSRAYADDGLFREERAPRTARVAAAPSRTPQMRLSIGGRASRSNSRRPQSEKIRAGKLVTPLWRRDSSARLNPLINQRPCSKHVVTSSRLRTTPLPVTRSSPPPPILKRKRLPEDSQSRVPRLVGRTNNVATNREGKEHTISIHSKQPVRRVVVRKRIVRRGGVLKRPAGVGAVDRIHSNRQYGYAKPRKDMLPVDLPPREADPLHMQEEEQISSEEVGEMDLEEETSYVMSDEDICRDQHNEISEDVMAEGYRYQQREVEDVSSEENARREEERKEWDRGKAAPPAKPPRPMHVLPDEPERRSKSRRRRCQKILARPRVSARRELHSLARPRQMVPQRKRSNDAQTSSLRAGPSLLPSSRPPQLRCRVKRLSEKPRLSMSGTKQVTEHGSKHQVGAERKESWVRGAISQTKVSTRGADEMHAKHISPRAMVQLRTQRKAELKQPIGEKVVDIEKEEQMKVAANSRRTRVDAIRQHSYVKPRDGKRSVDLRHRRRESSNKQVEEQISYDEFEDMDVDGGTSDDDLARGFHNEVGEENSEEEVGFEYQQRDEAEEEEEEGEEGEEVNSEEKGREQTENEELDDRKAAPPGKPPLRKPPVPTHVLTDEQEKRRRRAERFAEGSEPVFWAQPVATLPPESLREKTTATVMSELLAPAWTPSVDAATFALKRKEQLRKPVVKEDVDEEQQAVASVLPIARPLPVEASLPPPTTATPLLKGSSAIMEPTPTRSTERLQATGSSSGNLAPKREVGTDPLEARRARFADCLDGSSKSKTSATTAASGKGSAVTTATAPGELATANKSGLHITRNENFANLPEIEKRRLRAQRFRALAG